MIIAELIPGGHIQDLLRWHWDGDAVVQVPGSRHFRVDDQGRVPRVATTLGPDKVERFKGDATRGRRGRRVVVVRGAVVVVAVVARIVVVVFGGGDDVGGSADSWRPWWYLRSGRVGVRWTRRCNFDPAVFFSGRTNVSFRAMPFSISESLCCRLKCC